MLLHLFSARYRDVEWKVRDALARFGRKSPAQPEIVFLAIDNTSVTLDLLLGDEIDQSPALRRMQGGFPFPRDFYPLVIERLAQAGAKVIAFDMLFPQESALVYAFLTGNDRFKVEASLSMIHYARPDALRALIPNDRPNGQIDGLRADREGHFPSAAWLRVLA